MSHPMLSLDKKIWAYFKNNNIKLITIPYFEEINLAKLLGEENEEN